MKEQEEFLGLIRELYARDRARFPWREFMLSVIGFALVNFLCWMATVPELR